MNADAISWEPAVSMHPSCFLCQGDATGGSVARNNDGSFISVCSQCFELHWREFYRENSMNAGEMQTQEAQVIC